MKHKAKKKAVASEQSPNGMKDSITQHINGQGHKDAAQICLWIKDLYEFKDTELRCGR